MAAEWAGFETVGQCEWADYQTKVLEKHWPDVPRWRDIRTLTKESFSEKTGQTTVDLISGGFPCQPFSVAGQRKGDSDDRFVWPEMLRVISELQPGWVLGENVAGIVSMALDQVLSDLENIGYQVQAFIVPACAVDAPHRRDRVFIVGNTECDGSPSATIARITNQTRNNQQKRQNKTEQFTGTGESRNNEAMADSTSRSGQQSSARGNVWRFQKEVLRGGGDTYNWPAEPDVGRVANGISHRVDRLRCLGNAVVPQQVYPILAAIAQIEQNKQEEKQ